MKKYGIEIVDSDSTPGFRSRDISREWFDSESERDERFLAYTRKRPMSIDDMLCDNDYLSTHYSKIEKIEED